MKILLLLISLEFGWMPAGTFKMYESHRNINLHLQFYQTTEMEFQMFDNHFFFGGDVIMYFSKMNGGKSFTAESINYTIFTGLRFGWFELGYRHSCSHPVIAWMKSYKMNYEYWYDELYVKVQLQIGTK